MKIAFDLKNLWLYGKGIGLFSTNLLKDLSEDITNTKDAIQLYAPTFEAPALSFLETTTKFQKVHTRVFNKRSKFDKVKYDQYDFLRSLKNNKPDILFSPYFDIPIFWNKPTVTTIHDLSIFDQKEAYSKGYYLYYELLLKKAIKQSSIIVTVSDYSRKRIIETFDLSPDRVSVIYNKVPSSFIHIDQSYQSETFSDIKDKYGLPDEYILYTGGLEQRKNIQLLIKGLDKARTLNKAVPKLVITGTVSASIPSNLNAFLKNENVITLGLLPYDELAHLYRIASLIVNTSTFEGFGIPVLEALTVNKPMLCSDIPVYKEVGEDAVYYFENNNMPSFVNQLVDFFTGKLPQIDYLKMNERANFFNKKNYADHFYNIIRNSI